MEPIQIIQNEVNGAEDHSKVFEMNVESIDDRSIEVNLSKVACNPKSKEGAGNHKQTLEPAGKLIKSTPIPEK